MTELSNRKGAEFGAAVGIKKINKCATTLLLFIDFSSERGGVFFIYTYIKEFKFRK